MPRAVCENVFFKMQKVTQSDKAQENYMSKNEELIACIIDRGQGFLVCRGAGILAKL